ncbi:MAG: DoxX family protein [Gemmatimonadaceae bacterium]
MRISTGVIFAAHGAQKLFTFGFAGVAGAFGQMDVPFPSVMGPTVALLEFFGGLALILGLLTRLASAGLALNMLGAILLEHLSAGFFNPTGVEFPLSLFSAAVSLVLTGAGSWSVDALFARRGTESNTPALPMRRAA